MPQSIFLSYVHEDRHHRDLVREWISNGRLGSNVVATTESQDVRQQGEDAIRRHLEPKLRGAAAVVCLVGTNTHNHDWVRYELDVATSLKKVIVIARLPGTTGAAPVGHRHLAEVTFEPNALAKALGLK